MALNFPSSPILWQTYSSGGRTWVWNGTSWDGVNTLSVAWEEITGVPATIAGFGITDAQPLDADLTTIAALTPSADAFIVGDGTGWVTKSGAAALTALGVTTVGTGDFVRAINPLLSGVRYTQTVGELSGDGQGAVVIPATSDHFTITNGFVDGDSVTLPVGITGKQITVTNATGSDIFVYPAVDEEIWPNGSTDAPYPLVTGQSCTFTYAIGFSEASSGAAWIPKSMLVLPVTSVDGQTGPVNLSGTYLPLTGGSLTGNLLVGTSTDFTTSASTVPGAVAVDGYGVYPIQGPLSSVMTESGFVYQNSITYSGDNGASNRYLSGLVLAPQISNSGESGSANVIVHGVRSLPYVVSTGALSRVGIYALSGGASRSSTSDVSTGNSTLIGCQGFAQHGPDLPSTTKSNLFSGVFGSTYNSSGLVEQNVAGRFSADTGSYSTTNSATSTSQYGVQVVSNVVGKATGPTATVTNAYGLYLAGLNVGATGTVGTYCGIYLSAPTITGTVTTRYALYSADTGPSHLAGNLAIGATPNAWNFASTALELGTLLAFESNTNGFANVAYNMYRNSSGTFVYKATGYASASTQYNGEHHWYSAPSGTSGASVPVVRNMRLETGGYLDVLAGFKVNGAATSGQYLRGNGTGFVSSAIQASDIPIIDATNVAFAPLVDGNAEDVQGALTELIAWKLDKSGGTMTGAITFAAGQTWPTFNQNTTGSSGSCTGNAASASSVPWSGVTSKPTTLAGYGITDGGGGFPSGTVMLFVQTAAPTGWTKSTTHNDKTLRVVSGTASSGGTSAFSTVFASRTPAGSVSSSFSSGSAASTTATGTIAVSGGAVSATTLATTQIPSHSHTIPANAMSSLYPNWGATQTAGYGLYNVILIKNTTSGLSDNAQGGGTSHTHAFTNPTASFTGTAHTHTVSGSVSSSFSGSAMDFAVQYVDVIIATKN